MEMRDSLDSSLVAAGAQAPVPRRSFLKMTVGVIAGGIISSRLPAFAAKLIQLPFANGSRELVRFPQKGEMILLRDRPPLLETPFEVFDQGSIHAQRPVFRPLASPGNSGLDRREHLPLTGGRPRAHTDSNSRSKKFCASRGRISRGKPMLRQ